MDTPKTNLQSAQEKINRKREEVYKAINELILSDSRFENSKITYDDKEQLFTMDFSSIETKEDELLIIDLDDVRRSLKSPYEFLEDVEIILGNAQVLTAFGINRLKVKCLDYCHIYVGNKSIVSAGNDNVITISDKCNLECKNNNTIKTGILCNLKIGNNNNIYLGFETSLIGGDNNIIDLPAVENNISEQDSDYNCVDIKLGVGSKIITTYHNITTIQ